MKRHSFVQVDAFTTTPLAGNACAVVFDSDDLDDHTMLAIAREMNLSETAFVVTSRRADFGARYFTPAEEIPLAGHPTIATIIALVDAGRVELRGDVTRIQLELRVGPIDIEIVGDDTGVERVVMTQKKPHFGAELDHGRVCRAFGLDESDLMPGLPVQVVSTGTPQLMVPVRDHSVLKKALVEQNLYTELRREGGFFSPHLFCLGGATADGQTFARHFGVPPDTREDPFTGSATGGMAAYLWRYDLLDRPVFRAEQGHWMDRPGVGHVEVVGPRDDIESVKLGGAGVVVMRGELLV